MTPDQVNALMPLLASKFIQRREPVAQQFGTGGYRPLRDSETKKPLAIFNKTTLTEHLSGTKTYGHYMLDQNDMTKLFVLDIDLTQAGFVPAKDLNMTDPSDEDYQAWVRSFIMRPSYATSGTSAARQPTGTPVHQVPAHATREYVRKFYLRPSRHSYCGGVHR